MDWASRARRGVLTAGLLAALGGALWMKAVPCAFARLFHQPCPGCGSTRSVLALALGDLDGVIRNNPLGPLMAALMGVLAVQAVTSMFRRGDLLGMGEGRLGKLAKRGIMAVAVLEVLVWIARFFGLLGGPVAV
jgi:hypothetical protein